MKPEDWVFAAHRALAELEAKLGRPLSGELGEKFIAWAEAQQANAWQKRDLEDQIRRIARQRPKNGEDPELTETLLDVTQMGLDLAGVLDPTPVSDAAGAALSAWRGQWLDAGINVLGMLPLLGDLAKLGKLGKYPAKIAKAIEVAMKSEKAAELLKPVLKRLQEILERIPLNKLPDKLREPLEKIKKQLDNLFAKAEKSSAKKSVKSTLDELPGKAGKTGPIKEVPDADALDDLFDSLTSDAKTVPAGTYPGVVKELPDGTTVRRRGSSKSGGATLDITLPNGKIVKVHIRA